MALRITLGIDPGQTGAIAVLVDGVWTQFIDMPTMPRAAGGFQINALSLAASLRGVQAESGSAYVYAVLEQVSAMPGQGVSSTFRFGEGYGVVQGVLGALGIAVIFVHSSKWKKYMQLAGREKDVARTVAMQRYPAAAAQLTRKKDCGRADALLIGAWAEITEQVARTA